MEKVAYEDQQISNWLEYIDLKFTNQDVFKIKKYVDQGYIKIVSKTNKTKIWFYGVIENPLKLEDCQYSSDDCRGWSGESCAVDPDKHGIFSQENLSKINDFLDIPIFNGWVSVDYYIGSDFFKSISYEDAEKTKHILTYHNSHGCAEILLFPIFIILNYLVNLKLVGKSIKIIVDPIIKK